MILIYFYNILLEFYENIYFSNWRPYIAEKKDLGRLYVPKCPALQWKNGIAAL